MKAILTTVILFSAFATSAQSTKIGDFHLDKEYNIEATGTIYLDASDAKVFITGSKRTSTHVKIDREVTSKGMVFGKREFAVNVSEQSGNLSIKEQSRSSSVGVIGSYYEKYTINIEAPEGASLVIDGDDGDYFVKAINGSIELDLGDADVELTSCLGS
ncbi:MAG: hypothetical protein U5K54_29195 [Cytophagales bacterium]|nr:hypothetical protein [Cytophagales bacterium]